LGFTINQVQCKLLYPHVFVLKYSIGKGSLRFYASIMLCVYLLHSHKLVGISVFGFNVNKVQNGLI